MTNTPVSRSQDFLNTLGVNTHIPYLDGGYANIRKVAADLNYLGLAQVRDGISDGPNGSAPLSSYVKLAQQGIKFSIVAVNTSVVDTASLNTRLDLIRRLVQAVPGSVIAIEGANEVNNWPVTFNGVKGLQGAIDLQKALYTAVHNDPILAGIPVDYFTGYGAGSVGRGPDPAMTPGLADFNTQHPYPVSGKAPSYSLNPANSVNNAPGGAGPLVYTETGYSSIAGTWAGVNENVQARYTLDLLLDSFKYGVSKVDLYELMDAYAPGSRQGDAGFGLFDYTGAAKPVATAIHNLTTLLADTGAAATTFAPGSFSPTLTGLPATGASLAFQKSNGTVDLMVWAEPQIWDAKAGQELTAPTSDVTVDLGATYGSVKVYDPLTGTSPIASLTGARQLHLALTDHPLIVEVANLVPTVAVTSQMLAQDTGASATDNVTSNGKVTLSGTVSGATGTTVQVKDGQATLGTATLGPNGSWSYSTTLGTGTHQLVAVATQPDGSAVSSAAANSVTVLTAPPAITLTSEALASDGKTVTMTGTLTAASGTLISVYDGTTLLGPAALDGKGGWSFSTAPLAPGRYALTAVATDPAGNTASVDPPIVVPAAAPQPDTIVVNLSEDAYRGDAQVAFTVDGKRVGEPATITAQRKLGQSQAVTLTGDFGTGAHVVGVDFLNDLKDRAIQVQSITADGVQTVYNASQKSNGIQTYGFGSPAPALNQLTLRLSEDAYKGDAQFTVSVDGKQVGGIQTVTALHNDGAQQTFTMTGAFGAGTHKVAVNFLNDLWKGTAATDRNLYVGSININGTTSTVNAAQLSQGIRTYQVTTSVGSIAGSLPSLALNATAAGSTLVIDAAAGASSTVTMAGAGATVQFTDATTFKGSIQGFAGRDALDLRSFAFDGRAALDYQGSGTGGQLTLTQGAAKASLSLGGSYTAGAFHLSSDGQGGTLVTLAR